MGNSTYNSDSTYNRKVRVLSQQGTFFKLTQGQPICLKVIQTLISFSFFLCFLFSCQSFSLARSILRRFRLRNLCFRLTEILTCSRSSLLLSPLPETELNLFPIESLLSPAAESWVEDSAEPEMDIVDIDAFVFGYVIGGSLLGLLISPTFRINRLWRISGC